MKTLTILKTALFLGLFVCASPCFADNNEDLITACMHGDLAAVKKAVDAGADVNFVNPAGGTPLTSAAFYPEIEKFLLSKKADPNAGKQLPLLSAATYGSVESMKVLLDGGADPNKGNELAMGGIYDKMIADEEAKPKPNKALLKVYKTMADKAKSNPMYSYPLPTALMMTNNRECIELLINKGAKSDKTLTGNIFMDYATSGVTAAERVTRIKTMTENLEKAGMTVPDWYKNPDASKMASPDEIVKLLLKTGAPINGTNPRLTPLLFCLQRDKALKADEEVVMAFLTNGAKFDMDESNQGRHLTPILRVASLGYNKALTFMLDHGADQNADYKVKIDATGEDIQDVTPLMYAAEFGNLETVKLLISRGANYKTQAKGMMSDNVERCINKVKNKRVIFFAVESGNLELVKYLWEQTKYNWEMHRLDFEPIIDVKTSNGITTTTAFKPCHNNFIGFGPGQWAGVKGFKDIEDYIKSK